MHARTHASASAAPPCVHVHVCACVRVRAGGGSLHAGVCRRSDQLGSHLQGVQLRLCKSWLSPFAHADHENLDLYTLDCPSLDLQSKRSSPPPNACLPCSRVSRMVPITMACSLAARQD